MQEIKINASLSCIDLLHVQDQIEKINQSEIDGLHYDVVDGQFNQCFIFGDIMLEKIRPLTNKPITVHLAVENVEKYIEPMIHAGADYLAIHYETKCDHFKVFKKIRELGAKPVLAFKCDTEVPYDFIDYAKEVEWILKLTVHPGFAGQKIQPQSFFHIQTMNEILQKANVEKHIEADGNVNKNTIHSLFTSGATIFTGGTSGLFTQEGSIQENVKRLKEAI
ncbi:MAG: ribulose-phosphate 3-epimerase [Floccifex sp.]